MSKISTIIPITVALLLSNFSVAQTPNLSGKDFLNDGTGNIINMTTGAVYKDLGDGTVLNLKSGEIYKRVADGTIIKLETDINIPIKIK
ncbi:MAG: hypothetical protein VX986_01545 [Pseudomonadota bacterium]|nr:hypothetical protein [Pseudomonadota bacterium]